MNMEDTLGSTLSAVGYNPVSSLGNAFLFCQVLDNHVDVSHEFFVGLLQISDGRNMSFGDHQNMDWRLGINVPKGQY